MGATQSTRKITLVNDDKAGVIKLSESLAYRLRGQIEGQQAAPGVPEPAVAAEPAPPQIPPAPVPPPALAPSPPPIFTAPQVPEPPKISDYIPEPEPQVTEPPPAGESHPPTDGSFEAFPPGAAEVAEPSPLDLSPPAVPVELPSTGTAVAEESKVDTSDVAEDSNAGVPSSGESSEAVDVVSSDSLASSPLSDNPLADAVAAPAVPSEEDSLTATTPEPKAIMAEEVQLPSKDTLLAAAFASDVVEKVVATEPTAAPDIGIAVKSGAAPTLSQPAGSIPPWSIYAEEAHLMVMRLREEKEQEMKKLNNEWHKKMETREEEFTKIARLSEEQVTTSLKEVENLFMKATCSPVCQNHQEAVMNCYNDHPQQSLRCAREVEQFTQCVDLSRLQSVLRPKAN
ncbi:hypothetical protein C7M84_023827 [Penaeus vannamei]|uniref:Coiled-coil-helix-coiled-coil-helix domain-containing protein 3, mitochondrial n=1 Tax=Penaeus vannamei TaxID=6689 RepID=A0A423U2T0_PENVA|nr:hypothetical protein C7M84_023827 [Penaeus vannamei]